MKLLLDTHTLLWWWVDDPQLSAKARALLADPANEILTIAAQSELESAVPLTRDPAFALFGTRVAW